MERLTKYTLFVGLNDKDTKQQKLTSVEAYKVVETVCNDICNGATISEAVGIYKHNDGTVVIENSLRVELMYTTKDAVLEVIKMLKIALNQESIMMTEDVINMQYV